MNYENKEHKILIKIYKIIENLNNDLITMPDSTNKIQYVLAQEKALIKIKEICWEIKKIDKIEEKKFNDNTKKLDEIVEQIETAEREVETLEEDIDNVKSYRIQRKAIRKIDTLIKDLKDEIK